jgi:hypothetical protein
MKTWIVYSFVLRIYIEDNIYSSHYTYDTFKDIYHRRRNRLLTTILSHTHIIFCRFEADPVVYTNDDIDKFVLSVLHINKNIKGIYIVFITPYMELDHPCIIKVIYDKHSSDPFCNSKEIHDLFTHALQKIGYDTHDTSDICFTDLS